MTKNNKEEMEKENKMLRKAVYNCAENLNLIKEKINNPPVHTVVERQPVTIIKTVTNDHIAPPAITRFELTEPEKNGFLEAGLTPPDSIVDVNGKMIGVNNGPRDAHPVKKSIQCPPITARKKVSFAPEVKTRVFVPGTEMSRDEHHKEKIPGMMNNPRQEVPRTVNIPRAAPPAVQIMNQENPKIMEPEIFDIAPPAITVAKPNRTQSNPMITDRINTMPEITIAQSTPEMPLPSQQVNTKKFQFDPVDIRIPTNIKRCNLPWMDNESTEIKTPVIKTPELQLPEIKIPVPHIDEIVEPEISIDTPLITEGIPFDHESILNLTSSSPYPPTDEEVENDFPVFNEPESIIGNLLFITDIQQPEEIPQPKETPQSDYADETFSVHDSDNESTESDHLERRRLVQIAQAKGASNEELMDLAINGPPGEKERRVIRNRTKRIQERKEKEEMNDAIMKQIAINDAERAARKELEVSDEEEFTEIQEGATYKIEPEQIHPAQTEEIPTPPYSDDDRKSPEETQKESTYEKTNPPLDNAYYAGLSEHLKNQLAQMIKA